MSEHRDRIRSEIAGTERVGGESLRHVLSAGFTADPRSCAGRERGPSLLEVYEHHLQRLKVAKEVEQRAELRDQLHSLARELDAAKARLEQLAARAGGD